MKCNVCGRHTQNEEANFCDYCGSSFREQKAADPNSVTKAQSYSYMTEQNPQKNSLPIYNNMNQNSTVSQQVGETEKPVSLLNWIGTYGLFFIPVFGEFLFLIMLFIWAFGGKAPASKKNWARATLIYIPVFLFFLGYLILVVSSPMFQDMMKGTFDYNKFYESFYQSAY